MEASDADADAVARFRQGDEGAFRTLVERHGRAVFRLAYRMTGNEQDAEDVVQEAFLRAYRNLGRFEDRARFASWLHRIAANCAYDVLRGRVRRDEQDLRRANAESEEDPMSDVPSADPTPDRLVFSGEVRRKVGVAMARMSAVEMAEAIPEAARERILLLAVGDHLERSQVLLVELTNASPGALDGSSAQESAEALVSANRLYRASALQAGDTGVASVLEELERVLVEVAHQPPGTSAREMERIRRRIEDRGILFKVRVIESQVRERGNDGRKAPPIHSQVS